MLQEQINVRSVDNEASKEDNSVVKQALDENNRNGSSKRNSTLVLDPYRMFLTESLPRTYIPKFSHMFSILPPYCKLLVTESLGHCNGKSLLNNDF